MMTRVKLGMAVAVGLGIGFAGPVSAQSWTITNLEQAVITLNQVLDFEIGSTGDQTLGGNEEIDCPGGVEGGTEDIYDFGQDGVPDYAQMALVQAMYQANTSGVRAAVDSMRLGLETSIIVIPEGVFDGTDIEPFVGLINSLNITLPQLLEMAASPALGFIEFPEGVGETEAERFELYNMAIDALTLFAVIDNPANLARTICLDEIIGAVVGILTDLYNPAASNLNSLVDGSVVLGDGDTILDKWIEATGGKTLATDDQAFLNDVDTFVGLVMGGSTGGPGGPAATPFPPAPPGSPVAAPLGLALLAAGLGLAALRRSRKS